MKLILKRFLVVFMLLSCFILSSCGEIPTGPNPDQGKDPNQGETTNPDENKDNNEKDPPKFDFNDDVDIPEDGESDVTVSADTEGGYTYDEESNTYTITLAGTYTFSGELYEGRIVVDAPSQKVVIEFSAFKISNSNNAPLYFINASSVDLSAKSGTLNYVYDLRELGTDEAMTLGSGAVYAECDLTFKGKGGLDIIANYNNGIHTKKDLEIKNLTLNVKAVNNAIRGNDNILISSGVINAISSGGDGFKTSSTDLSKKGVQRGKVTIEKSVINIYAACDGIDCATDVIINDGTINIFTDKYSSYSGDVTTSSTTKIYLRLSSTVYNYAYKYSAYFYDAEGNSEWLPLSFYKSVTSQPGPMPPGGRGAGPRDTTYYYYVVEKPSKYTSVKFYAYNASQEVNQDTSYVAVNTSNTTVPSTFDTFVVTGISGSTISSSGWTSFQSQSGNQGLDYSCKGIKAGDLITINGGTINIESTDDGLHANFDDVLESTGNKGLGNITINGGTITIKTDDDGVSADQDLLITGGKTTVTKSYEGLEANRIYISGGEVKVYASDDGINANSKGAYSAYMEFSGGLVDVSVPTGDTDTLDSNGKILITGGTLILRNANTMGQSMTGGTFDTDNGVSITGGTVMALGCIGENLTGSTSSTSTTLSAGTYTLKDSSGNVIGEFVLEQSYRSYIFWSENFVSGTKYELYNGDSLVLSFTR